MLAPPGAIPPKLKRCLAELLRTCVHPPSLLLRVEHVFGKAQAGSHRNAVVHRDDEREEDHQDQIPITTGDDHSNQAAQGSDPRCFRLTLSDGHLQVQALVAPTLLFTTKELLDLRRGDLIEVHKFQVRSAPRLKGNGRVVYLGIQDCEWVGRDRETLEKSGSDGLELEEGGFFREQEQNEMFPRKQDLTDGSDKSKSKGRDSGNRDNKAHRMKRTQSKSKSSKPTPQVSRNASEYESDGDEGFATILIQQQPSTDEVIVNRRQPRGEYIQAETQGSFTTTSLLRSSNRSHQDSTAADGKRAIDGDRVAEADYQNALPDHHPTHLAVSTPHSASLHPRGDHITRPTSTTSIPPTIASLSSLLSLPIQKNYTCTVLAIISWVSPSLIHRPNTPFPPKRHIKIHDPSISHRTSGITVSVFVDAQKFLPVVGTVALFRGLVMHRVRATGYHAEGEGGGDVILNKYPPSKSWSQAQRAAETAEGGEESGDAAEGDGKGERDRQVAGGEWFICDETRLVQMGFDVQALKTWWEQRAAARTGKGQGLAAKKASETSSTDAREDARVNREELQY
ncbi:uncharacterized protein Z519_03877 [Cladophialophora bantiana CBS 173.52]|uniref:Uncharacterized protein n=1 Tax=Cladophialophora bantiana (strain ATCC 10958 / CBS 173.52 / CDC B-1940 / NIH 8579) TaxID=1442370 RepID=A0A0D2HPG7_CLAB1|nr:uncharacterized protein Z519_03877 [Cladophialophora bantiana CBS 173.52]KIW95293.1 hypothetical protein Z519_03877 [Cladophialophora bantiana CBS 173.52]